MRSRSVRRQRCRLPPTTTSRRIRLPRAFPRHRGCCGSSAGRLQHSRPHRKNIDNPTMLELAAHRNITAVKEASGDIGQVMELIARKPAGFTVLSGDDNLVFPIMALGGTGVISVVSNLVPKEMAAWSTRRSRVTGKRAADSLRASSAVQGRVHRNQSDPDQGGPGHEGHDHGKLPASDVRAGSAKHRESLQATLKEMKIICRGDSGPPRRSPRASFTNVSGEPAPPSIPGPPPPVPGPGRRPRPLHCCGSFCAAMRTGSARSRTAPRGPLPPARCRGVISTIEETTSGTG